MSIPPLRPTPTFRASGFSGEAIAPDETEPVIGWRVWRVDDSGHLYPVVPSSHPNPWLPRQKAVAACNVQLAFGPAVTKHEGGSPSEGCTCGLWALRARETARARLPDFATCYAGRGFTCAFGQVSLWGRVQQGALGWRAQFAYPYAIEVAEAKLARLIRKRYAVETSVSAELKFDLWTAHQPPHVDQEFAAAVAKTFGNAVSAMAQLTKVAERATKDLAALAEKIARASRKDT